MSFFCACPNCFHRAVYPSANDAIGIISAAIIVRNVFFIIDSVNELAFQSVKLLFVFDSNKKNVEIWHAQP